MSFNPTKQAPVAESAASDRPEPPFRMNAEGMTNLLVSLLMLPFVMIFLVPISIAKILWFWIEEGIEAIAERF